MKSEPRANTNDNEQVLSEGEFLLSQDTTKGITNIYTGPKVVTVTGQEYPVVFDPETRKFKPVALSQAVQQNILAAQGQYVEVVNPSAEKERQHPTENNKDTAPPLLMGQKVNIPGPATFAFFPRQYGSVIDGHQLRFNEYLMLRCYDEEKAKKNWDKAIIKAAEETEGVVGESKEIKKKAKTAKVESKSDGTEINSDEFSVGKLFIIKGVDVSFFIPPTGVEVLKDEDGAYVRQALTLGSLQFCILQDESGDKIYQHGPKVVFPKPTETFVLLPGENGRLEKIFRPVDLNVIQGIHVKIIQDYEENGKKFKEGDEVFLTGADTPIYYPRHEHSVIRYDGKDKHYATAIPSGEGRYILERKTGVVRMVTGPGMLLPNPIEEVIAKRVLSLKQCQNWYPGNQEVIDYNLELKEIHAKSPVTRRGLGVTEGELLRASNKNSKKNKSAEPVAFAGAAMVVSNVNQDSNALMVDQFTRGSSYTQPRTITMDTKFDGVPTIDLYTGYAVMVVSKAGERRVEVGPKTILLQFDESLEVLKFSTGKPKNTDNIYETVYLRVRNNQVSDKVFAETKDHVNVSINMSYRVNFEAGTNEDRQKWFEVDNYIKLLCDHIRSILKSRIRSFEIDKFFTESTSIIRDVLLGEKVEKGEREGRLFSENAMRLIDVEVLDVRIDDAQIAVKLQEAQHFAVESAIEVSKDNRNLAVTKEKERVKRETLDEVKTTQIHATAYTLEQLARTDSIAVKQHEINIEAAEAKKALTVKSQELENFNTEQSLLRNKAMHWWKKSGKTLRSRC